MQGDALGVPEGCAATGDGLDALIASLTARAAMQGRTLRPTPEQAPYARREGWIHLPTDFPNLLTSDITLSQLAGLATV